MKRLALWTALLVATAAAVLFTVNAALTAVAIEQARLESIAPTSRSTFKVHETVTLGRNGFAAAP
jgi:hypothetical protein